MKFDYAEFLKVATKLTNETGFIGKLDFHEIAEYLNISSREVFEMSSVLKSSGYIDYHPAGGFFMTSKPDGLYKASNLNK